MAKKEKDENGEPKVKKVSLADIHRQDKLQEVLQQILDRLDAAGI